MRVCAACRERHPAEKLLRFVRSGTRASADPLRRAQGRGLNLYPNLKCLENALKKRVFQRGLGVPLADDPAAARSHVVEALRSAIRYEQRGITSDLNGTQLLSTRRRERFDWLRQCLDEFTFTPANDRSHSFASGDTI